MPTLCVVTNLSPFFCSPVWGCLPGRRCHRAQRHQGGRGNAEEQDGGEKAESEAGKGNGSLYVSLTFPESWATVQVLPSCLRAWSPLETTKLHGWRLLPVYNPEGPGLQKVPVQARPHGMAVSTTAVLSLIAKRAVGPP